MVSQSSVVYIYIETANERGGGEINRGWGWGASRMYCSGRAREERENDGGIVEQIGKGPLTRHRAAQRIRRPVKVKHCEIPQSKAR
eukprot:scaffold123865_cov32-Tisochrysis_lutea.AAC.2